MTTIVPTRSPRDLQPPSAKAQVLPTHQQHFFPAEVETELSQSDHEAWTAVCTILITIVSLGLLLGLGGVLLTL